MGREKRQWNSTSFYHIVCRRNHREALFLDPGEILLNDVCGLICDWKNRKEYTLMEYILQLTQSSGY
ncbi:hypothetical protein P9265_18945 [Schinkia azotoformans]|uniref:hypothetical protein n=1 Tax=Schinkia azotoformans TaxID=1454 RepID=UPI002E1DCCFF|nr:hypothetical protein [Schinkia azotoformans]